MPYGFNYIDALNKMLYENDMNKENYSKTSRKIMHECSKCHQKTEAQAAQDWMIDVCSACRGSQLLLFDDNTGIFSQNEQVTKDWLTNENNRRRNSSPE